MVRTLASDPLTLREPWLPFKLVDTLTSRLRPGQRVFEYGGGGSTLWLVDLGADVVTVEHDRSWFDRLTAAPGCRQAEVRLRLLDQTGNDYVGAIDDQADESLDLVIVDGRERVRCFERSLPKVKPNGLLLLDDVDRRRYRRAFHLVDWPREVYVGFSPYKPSFAYTAVFTKPSTRGSSPS